VPVVLAGVFGSADLQFANSGGECSCRAELAMNVAARSNCRKKIGLIELMQFVAVE
jgi:enhancing lycopene biosynthesis protein 2